MVAALDRQSVEGMSEEISSLTGPWAELRFAVVGPLLASPPKEGRLQEALQELAAKEWRNPLTGAYLRFSFRTIERWYYQARRVPERQSPVSALRKRPRKDRGWQRSLSERMELVLRAQYAEHPSWSARLHHDNVVARAKGDGTLGEVPSYATVRRFLRSQGLRKLPRKPKRTPTVGQLQAAQRLEQREVRSYEVEHVGALWHLDFHQGSLPVLLANGVWEKPMLLGILDDHSRLACHLQWYLGETAEYLVHGLSQAVLKRGLPRALMSDNGSAMIGAETREGLLRIGVHHELTLPYSPYQNGKQEAFWRVVEGRLLAMLEGVSDLSLELLNRATQAWVEQEYNRAVHSEIEQTPLQRFLESPSLLRVSPELEDLRLAFTRTERRTQRKGDGTVKIRGVRYEVPSRYRSLIRTHVRFAEWDLSRVYLVDAESDRVLTAIRPTDAARNASGERRRTDATSAEPERRGGMAPRLSQLMADYALSGLPPAYVPCPESESEEIPR